VIRKKISDHLFLRRTFFKKAPKKKPYGKSRKNGCRKKSSLTSTNQELQRVSKLIIDRKKITDD